MLKLILTKNQTCNMLGFLIVKKNAFILKFFVKYNNKRSKTLLSRAKAS